jgi:DNA-binding MarR family transcriptional regulator
MLDHVNDRNEVLLPNSPRTDECEEMAITLLTLAKRIRVLFGMALAEAGFHNGQDQVLASLVPGKPVAVSVLAVHLDVRSSTISKMLDRLTDKGLVERRQVDKDRRLTLVCLTPEGEQAQADIRHLWSNVSRQVAAGLPGNLDETLVQLRGVSNVLAARLMKLR